MLSSILLKTRELLSILTLLTLPAPINNLWRTFSGFTPMVRLIQYLLFTSERDWYVTFNMICMFWKISILKTFFSSNLSTWK